MGLINVRKLSLIVRPQVSLDNPSTRDTGSHFPALRIQPVDYRNILSTKKQFDDNDKQNSADLYPPATLLPSSYLIAHLCLKKKLILCLYLG